MADIIRSAKSARDWTVNDLEAYKNIALRFEDTATFFGIHDLPQPSIEREVLSTNDANDMVSDRNAELINLLELAMKPAHAGESAVVDFGVELFKQLGYIRRRRVARTRKDIPLFICGEWRHAKTDVCIVDCQQDEILLLVQEDKLDGDDTRDAQHHLVAAAIATFSENNRIQQAAGQATSGSKVVPGIVLAGTTPTFYKIPVTADLVRHVRLGTYPQQTTTVSVHVPEVPRPLGRYSEGMKPLDNRQAILRCYEAFKGVVGV